MSWTALALLAAGAVALASPAMAQSDLGDPLIEDQPGLDQLGLPDAWSTSTGEGVVIAIVDSGVDPAHPDLATHLVAGRDIVDGDDRPDDETGTGTHAAGIAAAVTGNGEGIAGAAPDALIMPVRVLDADGAGTPDDIAAGITWAAENGAAVVNLSLGGRADLLTEVVAPGPVSEAVRAAATHGVVVVAAAATDDGYAASVPDDLPALLVNAVDGGGAADPLTTFTDARAVSAPGTGVLSTSPLGPTTTWPDGTEGYEALDGVAVAAPHVAGAAALLVAQGLTPDEVRDLLTATAQNPEGDPGLGAGIVDAAAAVTQGGAIGAGPGPALVPGESGDGLPPALVGGVAISAALLAVGSTLALARRRPRQPDGEPVAGDRRPLP